MKINPLVLKLGLVRFATSLLFILLANVLNRVLMVELRVPASLVTFSFAFQHLMAPVGLVTGYASDAYALAGRHRTPYIWGGMLLSLVVMPFFPVWALALEAAPTSRLLLWEGVALFSLFGIGTTMSATAINALLVDRIPEEERGSAMTLLWILTLGGFIAGSVLISYLFPTFDAAQLKQLFGLVTALALAITLWGAWDIEPREQVSRDEASKQLDFWRTLRFLGRNPQSLSFFLFLMSTIFFLAIQTFLLTPFGGEVLKLEVGATSRFGVSVTYGILFGMVGLYLIIGNKAHKGCKTVLAFALTLGALAFVSLSWISFQSQGDWLFPALWLLGLSRGLYNVGLSHLTMYMAHPAFSGIFMGLWNLVSGLALAAGEMMGGALRDWLVQVTGSQAAAYGWLFLLEGLGLLSCLLFLLPLKQADYQVCLGELLAKRLRTYETALAAGAGRSSHESQ
jgi:BCD family chlorophyll transporter-like MFS transporter